LSAFYSGDTYTCHEATGSASAGAKADFLLRRITSHLPPGTPRTLLDYGAGGGGFLAHARDRGWKVQGFEPGKRGLESCRQAGLDVTDKLDDLPSDAFGLVSLHHVFEHLANPIETLGAIRRFLAHEGRLYIEVPNARSLRARMASPLLTRRFRVDERYRAYPIHLMYYSDRTLRRMLEKAGWTVEATFTIGMGLDEFLIRPETSYEQTARRRESDNSGVPRNRRLRHKLRDAFLGLGMGENLGVIAYPKRS
jgi:SAM-dependent methyltransferase